MTEARDSRDVCRTPRLALERARFVLAGMDLHGGVRVVVGRLAGTRRSKLRGVLVAVSTLAFVLGAPVVARVVEWPPRGAEAEGGVRGGPPLVSAAANTEYVDQSLVAEI